jgi:hypothetical protein
VDTRGKTKERGGPDGLGGNWAVDRRLGTGVMQNWLLRLESESPQLRNFLSHISSPKICVQNVLFILYVFFLCRLKINHEMEYFMCLFLVQLT